MAIKSSSKKTLIFKAPEEATLVADVFGAEVAGVEWCVPEEVPDAWVSDDGWRLIAA